MALAMSKDENDRTHGQPPEADAAIEIERLRRQRKRSIAIAVALVAMIALFYIATLVRLGANVFNRPI